mmetsp:Transcript_33853/g.60722  ORF Transcript_33853/g.60722 Transcript_33853/m.60722 type:complete len:89 (+) Transcript_33853:68-334(+)
MCVCVCVCVQCLCFILPTSTAIMSGPEFPSELPCPEGPSPALVGTGIGALSRAQSSTTLTWSSFGMPEVQRYTMLWNRTFGTQPPRRL